MSDHPIIKRWTPGQSRAFGQPFVQAEPMPEVLAVPGPPAPPKPETRAERILRIERERHEQKIKDLNAEFQATINHFGKVEKANEDYYRKRLEILGLKGDPFPPPAPLAATAAPAPAPSAPVPATPPGKPEPFRPRTWYPKPRVEKPKPRPKKGSKKR